MQPITIPFPVSSSLPSYHHPVGNIIQRQSREGTIVLHFNHPQHLIINPMMRSMRTPSPIFFSSTTTTKPPHRNTRIIRNHIRQHIQHRLGHRRIVNINQIRRRRVHFECLVKAQRRFDLVVRCFTKIPSASNFPFSPQTFHLVDQSLTLLTRHLPLTNLLHKIRLLFLSIAGESLSFGRVDSCSDGVALRRGVCFGVCFCLAACCPGIATRSSFQFAPELVVRSAPVVEVDCIPCGKQS